MKPLLRRTKLLPGETLPSLLERLTRLNYYDHPGVISQICQDADNSPGRDYLSRPKRSETFAQLTRLTGIASEKLFAASAHRFAPILTAPGQKKTFLLWPDGQSRQIATNGIVGRRIRSPSAAQFCPLCLNESAYQRQSWVPVASAICLQHQCLLIHRCPDCDKKVTVSEIIADQCFGCRGKLSSTLPISVTEDEPGILSQQVIQSWLTVAPAPTLSPGYVLPTQDAHVLFHLLRVFCRGLLACQEDWPRLPPPLSGLSQEGQEMINARKILSPHSAYFLYRAAFQAVVNWPHGFYKFLDAYSQRTPEAQTSPTPHRRLGILWLNWISTAWQRPELEFVHQALADYFVCRRIPMPRRLDVSERGRDTFSQNGPLGQCMAPKIRSRFSVSCCDKALTVKEEWAEGLSLADAARWLGLQTKDALDLVDRRELKLSHGQRDGNPEDWRLERHSLVTFFQAIDSQLELYRDDPHALVCLYDAFCRTAWSGLDIPTLLKGIADGVLPGYKLAPSLDCLAEVCFLDPIVPKLPDLIYAQRGWVRDFAFTRQKGLKMHTIDKWMRRGLLEPVATFEYLQYFDVQSIERVAAEYPLWGWRKT